MTFDPALLATYTPRLLTGLGWTAALCLAALVVAVPWGFTLALLRRAHWSLDRIVAAYVSALRGTPLLIQLFLAYYGGPQIGLVLSAAQVGMIGLALYGGAYYAEIFRAGLNGVARGQVEAARALGLSWAQAMRQVQLPQLLALALPPATGQAIVLLKESAVLSVITVPELTFETTRMVTETLAVVEPYFALALLYWLASTLVATIGQRAEAALTRHLHLQPSHSRP